MPRGPRIFFSHSSVDVRVAKAVEEWLTKQFPRLGGQIFLDVSPETGILPGQRWKETLRDASASCEAVICLLSRNWDASHECRAEYRAAELLNKQIFVARLEPSDADLFTSEWQRCDLYGEDLVPLPVDGDEAVPVARLGLERLRLGIERAGFDPHSFPWPPQNDPNRSPYRGWRPFEERDAAVFFGRDAAIVRALDQIRGTLQAGRDAMFVVLGPSGTGKSSFLRAGLMPRLRRDLHRFALLDVMRPGRDAFGGANGFARSLYNTLKALNVGGVSQLDVAAACGRQDKWAIVNWLNAIRGEAAKQRVMDAHNDSARPTVVLPIDQAEELFGEQASSHAEEFLALLRGVLDLMNDQSGIGLMVIVTIRTDRYAMMQTHPALAGVSSVLFDELKPMPRDQFQEVIKGPAESASQPGRQVRLEPLLVTKLLEDTGDKGGDTLPALSLVLARLYHDQYEIDSVTAGGPPQSTTLTLASYQDIGALQGVVQHEIDQVLAPVGSGDRRKQLTVLRSAFIPSLAMIDLETDQPKRRVALYEELPESSRPLIEQFIKRRLLVKGAHEGSDGRRGDVVVEVALESLLREWKDLASWLDDERADLKTAHALKSSAAAWDKSNRDEAELLRGSRLARAEAVARKDAYRDFLQDTRDYLTRLPREGGRRPEEGATGAQGGAEVCQVGGRGGSGPAHLRVDRLVSVLPVPGPLAGGDRSATGVRRSGDAERRQSGQHRHAGASGTRHCRRARPRRHQCTVQRRGRTGKHRQDRAGRKHHVLRRLQPRRATDCRLG